VKRPYIREVNERMFTFGEMDRRGLMAEACLRASISTRKDERKP
jgi:hypothetical protein